VAFQSAQRKERYLRGQFQKIPYNAKERDAIDYFAGNNVYAIFQDVETKLNKLDTRETFLLKMHDPEGRESFLNFLIREKKTL
jgi:hypothetical protein